MGYGGGFGGVKRITARAKAQDSGYFGWWSRMLLFD